MPEFTGISAPYEEPEQPELVIATDARSLDDCVEQVIAYVEQRVTLS
ncbi:adenylyl-sulfate kinase [Acinetobacter baumannii]